MLRFDCVYYYSLDKKSRSSSPKPVMSQPYPVPIPLAQSKSRPLPDSRGIPDTFNLFLFGKPMGPDESHIICDIDCISRD